MALPIEFTVGGVRWRMAAEHREALLGPDGLHLDEWLRDGSATVVKQNPHRIVYRVERPGLRFHLKRNIVADARTWLRQLVRPSKGRAEYDRALAVAARGVPTVVPLALGERCDGIVASESFLLTYTLEGAVPLDVFLRECLPAIPAGRQPRVRQRLAMQLGEFIARMHRGGVLQHDLHCGNLLVTLDEQDLPHFYLVDLQAVRLRSALGWRESRRNLVILNRWLATAANRSDRLRFWRAYCRFRKEDGGRRKEEPETSSVSVPPSSFLLHPSKEAELVRTVEGETLLSNQRFWRHRDQRCLQDNRQYHAVRANGLVGHAVSELDPEALAALLADPDGPFRRPLRPLLKNSRSATVADLEFPVGGRVHGVIYKRFRLTDCRDPWLSWLRRPPALRSWLYGHGLRQRGLPTARPLAVFHRQRWGMSGEGYLLMEKVQDAVDLRELVTRLGGLDSRARASLLRPLIDELARLVRELHRRHLSHRDLKAANVLVQAEWLLNGAAVHSANGSSEPPALNGYIPPGQLWFIDLVGVARRRRLPRSVRVRNLTRLHVSFRQDPAITRTDKLRFLRAYMQWGLLGRRNWKRLWGEIAQATLAKIAHNARNGRALS